MDAPRNPLLRLTTLPDRAWWTAVFLCGLAIRLAWLTVWERQGLTQRLGCDSFFLTACSWHGWSPPITDITHPPLFPFWIYILLAVVGRPSLLAVQAANVLFSSLSPLLLGLWAQRAFSRPVARLAALWAALDPLLIFFAPQAQSESFFVFLELLFFLALQAAGELPSAWSVFSVGLFGGAVALARSVFGPFAPFLTAAMLWPHRRRARAWLWLLLLAGWAVGPSLWGARNLRAYGRFVPLASNGGWNLWEGFTLDREEVRRRPFIMGEEALRAGLAPEDVLGASAYFEKKTRTFVKEHPLQAARIMTGKFFLYWRPWPYDPHSLRARIAASLYFMLLFSAAALGVWALRTAPAMRPMLALFVFLSLLHSVFFTSLRYRVPLEPFLCVLAAAGVLRLSGQENPE